MREGQLPIHIQRFSPADLHGDEHVRLLKSRRDYRTLTFYRHFIDQSFLAGGDLPADVEMLSAVVEMPRRDVEKALAFCLGRLIFQDGERLYQRRVRRDVQSELEFRELQREHGKKGGRPKKKPKPLPDQNPSLSPPSPTPAPAPSPTPAPSASTLSGDASHGRVDAEREANRLLAALAGRRGLDPRELLAEHAAERGWRGPIQPNVAAMGDSVFWPLLSWLREQAGEREPVTRLTDRQKREREGMRVSLAAGLKGDGTVPMPRLPEGDER